MFRRAEYSSRIFTEDRKGREVCDIDLSEHCALLLKASPMEAEDGVKLGEICKSDVKVLLHFECAKTMFSSRNMQVFDVGEVKVLLHEKKIWERAFQVQHQRGDFNVLSDNGLRRRSPSKCCSRVAMRRQSACPRHAFLPSARQNSPFPTLQHCNTRKLFCACVCFGRVGVRWGYPTRPKQKPANCSKETRNAASGGHALAAGHASGAP